MDSRNHGRDLCSRGLVHVKIGGSSLWLAFVLTDENPAVSRASYLESLARDLDSGVLHAVRFSQCEYKEGLLERFQRNCSGNFAVWTSD